MNELDSIVDTARAAFAEAATPAELENAKAQFIGKAGRITELMKGMAALSVDEKKSRGAAINVAKQAIEAALNERRQAAGRRRARRPAQGRSARCHAARPRCASPAACIR